MAKQAGGANRTVRLAPTQGSGMQAPDLSADDATGPDGGEEAIVFNSAASCWN